MSRTRSRRSRAPAAAGDIAERLRNSTMPLGAMQRAVERLRVRDNGDRLYAIVKRCDIGREMHKVVAAELGLSRRQFYRDLATARRLIDESIRGEIQQAPPPATSVTPFDAQLQTAIAIAAGGHRRAALNYFSPVVESPRGDEAIWGRSILAEFLLEDGDLNAAERELQRALEASTQEHGLGIGRALLIRANVLHEAGRADDAAHSLERCIEQVEPYANSATPLALDTFSRALTALAFCYQARGDFTLAATIHGKNPAAMADTLVSPMARIEYLNVNAMLACDGVDGPSGARAACDAFYEFAARHGFLEEISAALLQLGGIARFERRLNDAARFAQESLAIHRAIRRPAAPILSVLTGVALDKRDFTDAVRLAHETRAEAAPGSHAWWGSHLYEAEALAQNGRHDEARSICARVANEVNGRDTRIAAWLRRVEATAFGGLGDNGAAYRAAGSALEILGDAAPPFHRLKSLMVAQRIRPTRSHRAQIRELTAVLGWGRHQELPHVGRI